MQQDLVQAMKHGMRRLVSGVSVVTAKDAQGQRFAMTASSVTSVSDAPPSLLVCVNQNAAICEALSLGANFAVNVLSQVQQDVSVQCSIAAKGEQRFAVGQWGEEQGVPVLQGAEAVFVCSVDAVYQYGTHNIVIGQILSVDTAPGSLDPLIYLDGGYRTVKL